ncbi:MAG: class I SAM-dependent methyltransferase, partial [Gemmatimonadetes bacterium]|nr:class I SAM-dependent methyltransferase [Gemmatimonadota bacterium]
MRVSALARRITAALPPAAERHGLATEYELFPQLEALSADYVAEALQQLGWRFESGQYLAGDDVMQACGILPRYRRLLTRLLDILAEEGVLARSAAGGWEVRRAPQPVNLRERWDALLARYPIAEGQLRLTGACGEQLAGVLTGAVDPLALLFPGGSLELAERLYRESPKAQVFNGLVQEAVAGAVAGHASGRLRVLEIGAGTGATTASVLPVLPAERTEYVFSDLSPAFLSRARERFAGYDFVDYRILDIERDPAAQGFSDERFDLVLAVNVLHATADLAQTLRHVRSLLAPGGLLLLVEGTGPERWIDITFGLTDGWWRFADTAVRPSYPLLLPARWSELLAEAGFAEVAVGPAEAEEHRQAILLARTAAQPANTRPSPLAGEGAPAWLILGDVSGVGERLGALLRASGQRCLLAPATEEDGALEEMIREAAREPEQ